MAVMDRRRPRKTVRDRKTARWWWILVVVAAAGLAGACAPQPTPAPEEAPAVESAVAVLHPTEGQSASGVVRFAAEPQGIRVSVRLEGLAPGLHGFHVHEWGDCSKPDGTSAGGHFDPTDAPHGSRAATPRHVGDLGNVAVDEAGTAEANFIDTVIALDGPHSIVGRAVIVHAGEDDFTTQPTGAAGPRAACGVVGVSSSMS